jgi:hypothetical protein
MISLIQGDINNYNAIHNEIHESTVTVSNGSTITLRAKRCTNNCQKILLGKTCWPKSRADILPLPQTAYVHGCH